MHGPDRKLPDEAVYKRSSHQRPRITPWSHACVSLALESAPRFSFTSLAPPRAPPNPRRHEIRGCWPLGPCGGLESAALFRSTCVATPAKGGRPEARKGNPPSRGFAGEGTVKTQGTRRMLVGASGRGGGRRRARRAVEAPRRRRGGGGCLSRAHSSSRSNLEVNVIIQARVWSVCALGSLLKCSLAFLEMLAGSRGVVGAFLQDIFLFCGLRR
jgi:hypothetical protein